MEIGNINSILSLAVLVATYFIIKPLQVSIDGLKSTMEKLTEKVDNLISDNTDTQVHIVEIEQVAKSNQKRIGGLEERVHDVEQRCVNCVCRKG
jgi:ATP-dependent 26S proteasome regulatory subunit